MSRKRLNEVFDEKVGLELNRDISYLTQPNRET